jgi:hypothetical protein
MSAARCATAPISASNMLIGAFYAQYLGGDPFVVDWAEQAVGTVLKGLSPGVSPPVY